ncbi:39S ribosomal protein L37, mitochondrial [Desmophyllum pertusum]|uniref:Large ribosomal subunit protein mL37 n=1 Tax=Desmophyllum pertusum TaxID=174260 RepID=A0A9W9YFF6_9CNID|nr:39S ribosomal protein L37, mitochondrial [Desmophyllum pertusum]
MAAFCAFARGKLTTRILPSFLYTRGYCDAVAKESYLYHPKIRPLEPEIQTLSLTKTLHMGDISSCLQETFIDPVKREAMMSKFKQNIIQTRLFNFEGDVATRDMSAMPLMQNMLRVVWSYANSFPGLLDTSLTYKPHTFAFWEREHLIQVSGRLGFLLSSKNQLKQVADSEEVQKTKEIQVDRPEIISPVFHLHSTNIEPKFEPGFYSSAPFPYPHTFIIVSEDTRWPTNQLVGQGIMFSCARLVAEAVENHKYQMGDELEKPLTAQCIVTDGIRFSFIFYQLNTLCFHDDKGVKNMAWISPGCSCIERQYLTTLKREKKLKGKEEVSTCKERSNTA